MWLRASSPARLCRVISGVGAISCPVNYKIFVANSANSGPFAFLEFDVGGDCLVAEFADDVVETVGGGILTYGLSI